MRALAVALSMILAGPALGQEFFPPATAGAQIDTSQFVTPAQAASIAQAQAASAVASDTTRPTTTQAQTIAASAAAAAVAGLPTTATVSTMAATAAQAAIAADTIHATASALSAVAATVPTPMLAVPGPEVVGGAVGTAGTYRTGNSVQPRITRVVSCTTDATGNCTASWSTMGSAPGVIVVPPFSSATTTLPPDCGPIAGTVSATGVQVRCVQAQSVVVTLLGNTVAPFTSAAAGLTVTVLAIPYS